MIREHDVIRLKEDFVGLPAGTIGTVLLIHNQGEAYEVEFLEREGETFAVPGALASIVATGDGS